jgi:hypothetical protein
MNLMEDVPIETRVERSSPGLNLSGENSMTQLGGSLKGLSATLSGITPEVLQVYQTSEARVMDPDLVGNKFYQLVNEKSNHLKWEGFRQLALADNKNEDCSNWLRKMELEDSETEVESVKSVVDLEEDGCSLGDLMQLNSTTQTKTAQEEEDLRGGLESQKMVDQPVGDIGAVKKQKRKWGPSQRMDRPRRVPEHNRTMLQKAQDLKKARNSMTGMTQKTPFAFKKQ